MKPLRQLYVQVLIGIALGIGLGILAPGAAVKMKPLGDGFIALLRLLLAPIIFCTVVHGLASVQGYAETLAGSESNRSYTSRVVSTISLIFGLVLVNVFKPGLGLHAANPGGKRRREAAVLQRPCPPPTPRSPVFSSASLPARWSMPLRKATSFRFCSFRFWSVWR